MNETDVKIKHLEFIHAAIGRMVICSFVARVGSIFMVTWLLGLAILGSGFLIALLAVLPVMCFWFLDAACACREQQNRQLYDRVRMAKDDFTDFFNMETAGLVGVGGGLIESAFSLWMLVFHVPVCIVVVFTALLVAIFG